MADFLNFDDLEVERIGIQKRGRRWDLRADVPARLMLRVMRQAAEVQALLTIPPDAPLTTAMVDEVEAAFTASEVATLHLLGDIFRHTAPETTDDELADLFALEEQQQIIQLFMQRRLTSSGVPPNDSTARPATRGRQGLTKARGH